MQQSEAGGHQKFILVQTKRKAHPSLFQKLDYLDDVFAGVCEGKGWGG